MPVKDKNGKTLMTEEEQNVRWVQPHPSSTFDFEVKPTMQQLEVTIGPITRDEVDRTIRQLKNNKAHQVDEKPAELLKCRRDTISEALQDLFNTM